MTKAKAGPKTTHKPQNGSEKRPSKSTQKPNLT